MGSEDAPLENINNIGDNISQTMFDKLVDSMPHRVKAALEAKSDRERCRR